MKKYRLFSVLLLVAISAGYPAWGARAASGVPLIAQAEESFRNGEYVSAAELLSRALEMKLSGRQRYNAFLTLGECSMRLRQYARAIEYFREGEQLMPGEEGPRLSLGSVYEESELYELARQKYQEILDRDRRSYEANYRLGRLLLKQGMHTQAMEYFRRALALRSSAEIYRGMSACAERSGDIGMAIAMLRQSAQMGLNYDDFVTLGRLYGRQKRIAESEETFCHAIKLAPNRGEAYIYLALLYFENGRVMPSEKLLAMAAEKAPDEAVVQFLLSIIAGRNHDRAGALREIMIAEQKAKTEELRSYARRFRDFLDRP